MSENQGDYNRDQSDREPGEYVQFIPFWIDTDAYSDRDRDMFSCGFEFAIIMKRIQSGDMPTRQPIHVENESRIRMLCAKLKVLVSMERMDDTWTSCTVSNR